MMKSFKEYLEEAFKIEPTEYGTNEPKYDNKLVKAENDFIHYVYFKHNETTIRVEFYDEGPEKIQKFLNQQDWITLKPEASWDLVIPLLSIKYLSISEGLLFSVRRS